MKIGIIGAGMIGATAARGFIKAGHDVAISNSRGPASLADIVAELGSRAKGMTVEEAARWGDVILLAVPFRSPEALPPADAVAGKIVIDAMNPYGTGGTMIDLKGSSSSEETRKRLPGARIVKAFNTIFFKHLAERGNTSLPADQRHAIFVAGDDEDAKRVVVKLIDELGFAAVDTGSLAEGGRRQEPNTSLYNKMMTGLEAREAVERAGGPKAR